MEGFIQFFHQKYGVHKKSYQNHTPMKTIIITLKFMVSLVFLMASFFLYNCENEKPIPIPKINIPDIRFLNTLIEKGIDTNGDGIINPDEAEKVTSLDVSNRYISNMTGIEAFANLDSLHCGGNVLSSLDLSNNIALKELDCGYNNLTSLNLSRNTALKVLYCGRNQLTSLDISTNTELISLNCEENNLSSLDISNNIALQSLICSSNKFTNLNLSNNTSLNNLECSANQLTSLDISNTTKLIRLECGWNYLTDLDLSHNNMLEIIELGLMPSLNAVCVWRMPFPPENVDVYMDNSPNVYFTMNCN